MIPDGSWTKTGFHHSPTPGKAQGLDRCRVGIVVALWNREITEELERGCRSVLLEGGLQEDQIETYQVPGCFVVLCIEYPDGCRHCLGLPHQGGNASL